MVWNPFQRVFSQHIAMDLGTANTLLYAQKHGVIINEPSVVAWDRQKQSVIAVGEKARNSVGKHCTVIRPLSHGVIANFDMAREMIAYFVRKAISGFTLFKPSLFVCIPTGRNLIEKRAVKDAVLLAGASSVHLIEEPMAACIGAGLAIHEPVGRMVVVIGGGTCEIAVISLGGIVCGDSIPIAGDEMTASVQSYIRDFLHSEISEDEAERIKKTLGTLLLQDDAARTLSFQGKSIPSGETATYTITKQQVRESLQESAQSLVTSLVSVLGKTPPELVCDIVREGILVTGGGALIGGLASYIEEKIHIPVHLDKDPLTTVLRGTVQCMQDPLRFRDMLQNEK